MHKRKGLFRIIIIFAVFILCPHYLFADPKLEDIIVVGLIFITPYLLLVLSIVFMLIKQTNFAKTAFIVTFLLHFIGLFLFNSDSGSSHKNSFLNYVDYMFSDGITILILVYQVFSFYKIIEILISFIQKKTSKK